MSPRHTYTILSMMKDEGHSLVEWVAYHRHIGFDNIVVYTNDCSDGTDAMLIRLEEMGWVRHCRNDVPEGRKPQPNALGLAVQNPDVLDSDWVLVMDADEFVSVKCGRGRIEDLVDRIPAEAQAMAITWRFFGSNGLTEWNPGLVVENYTQAAPDMFKKGWGVKTLFRPYRDLKLGIHRPTIKKARQDPDNAKFLFEQLWVNGSGEPMPDEFSLSGWRSTKPTLGYGLAEINHYAVKSYEAYLLRRVRGNVNNKEDKYNAAYFALFDRNEVEATNALRHLKGTKKKMAEILSDPVMRKLQDEALAFHQARVQALRSTGEYDRWLAELKAAAEVPLDALDEVLFTQHLPKKWQEKVKELQAQGVPDKTIARMIAATQTAKKGETRTALMQAAGVKTADDTVEQKAEKREAATRDAMSLDKMTLDNPFLGTPEAAALGVPALQPGAPAAPDRSAPAAADRAAAPTSATVSLDAPAPPLDEIVAQATVSASEGLTSEPEPRRPVRADEGAEDGDDG